MLKIVLFLISDLVAYRRAVAGGARRTSSGLGHVSIWPVEGVPSAPPFPAGR